MSTEKQYLMIHTKNIKYLDISYREVSLSIQIKTSIKGREINPTKLNFFYFEVCFVL